MMNKVILVDDEYYVRQGLKSLIDWGACQFEVAGEADNGEDALDLIGQIHPDLVITDIRMPGIDGLELIRQAKESAKTHAEFIIISGYSDFKYAQQAVRFGVHDFVLKPIEKEELEATLLKLSESMEKEKKVRQRSQEVTMQTALDQLILGEVTPEAIAQSAKQLKIDPTSALYYVILEAHGSDLGSFKQHGSQMAADIAGLPIPVDLREQHHGRYGLILSSESLKRFHGNIDRFLSKFHQELSQRHHMTATAYIGTLAPRLEGLRQSYQAAQHACLFKYIEQGQANIAYDQVHNLTVNYAEMNHGLYRGLMDQIEENNREAIVQAIDKIFEEFRTKRFAPEAVKTSINRCVHGFIQILKSMGGEESQLSTWASMVRWHESNISATELKRLFSAFILEGTTLISAVRKENGKGDIQKVKNYIDAHFNQNISLKSIAGVFYMNPVYMGQLFKKTYGVYFKEYLMQIRIHEAKKLLRQSDKRIYQIAEEVGFGSPDYFVTQFEKLEQMTPTEYRNHLLEK